MILSKFIQQPCWRQAGTWDCVIQEDKLFFDKHIPILSFHLQHGHKLANLFHYILFLKNLFILFTYFWLHWVFVLCTGFLQLRRAGTPLRCSARASHCSGFSCCGAWALGARASVVIAHGLSSCGSQASRAQAQQLWCMGLVALQHVGSSRTRDRTRVPCIGRRILNHCATREALSLYS